MTKQDIVKIDYIGILYAGWHEGNKFRYQHKVLIENERQLVEHWHELSEVVGYDLIYYKVVDGIEVIQDLTE